jgi:hypothetical protein
MQYIITGFAGTVTDSCQRAEDSETDARQPVTGIFPQGDMSCGIVPFGMIVILFRN